MIHHNSRGERSGAYKVASSFLSRRDPHFHAAPCSTRTYVHTYIHAHAAGVIPFQRSLFVPVLALWMLIALLPVINAMGETVGDAIYPAD